MIDRLVFALIVVLSVAAGAALRLWWPEYQVRQAVKASLVDPDSATFSNVTYNRDNKVGCGVVNAKNKMGGYAGRTPSVLLPNGELRLAPSDTASTNVEQKAAEARARYDFQNLIDTNCNR